MKHSYSAYENVSKFRKAKQSIRQPTQGRDLAISGSNKKSIWPILFLYYEETLVSSNLNSNLLRFHCAHSNLSTYIVEISEEV